MNHATDLIPARNLRYLDWKFETAEKLFKIVCIFPTLHFIEINIRKNKGDTAFADVVKVAQQFDRTARPSGFSEQVSGFVDDDNISRRKIALQLQFPVGR